MRAPGSDAAAHMANMQSSLHATEDALHAMQRKLDEMASEVVSKVIARLQADGALQPIVMTKAQLDAMLDSAIARRGDSRRARIAQADASKEGAAEMEDQAQGTGDQGEGSSQADAGHDLGLDEDAADSILSGASRPLRRVSNESEEGMALSLAAFPTRLQDASGTVSVSTPGPTQSTMLPPVQAPLRKPRGKTSRNDMPTTGGDIDAASGDLSEHRLEPPAKRAKTTRNAASLPKPPNVRPIRALLQTPSQTGSITPPACDDRRYLWNDAWHLLPEEFELPKDTVSVMWRMWCCADPTRGFAPLRQVETNDLSKPNDRKRFSDLRFLMRHFEKVLREKGVWKDSPSALEVDQMLQCVKDNVGFAQVSGRRARLEDQRWMTTVKLLRDSLGSVKRGKEEIISI